MTMLQDAGCSRLFLTVHAAHCGLLLAAAAVQLCCGDVGRLPTSNKRDSQEQQHTLGHRPEANMHCRTA
jgi:hypothetical protein